MILLGCSLLCACAPKVVRYNDAGNQAFDQQLYENALHEYQLAQVEEPEIPEPYYNAANSLNRLGELEGILTLTQQALKNADPKLASQAWFNLGNAYFDRQDWPQAIESYQEALRLQPQDMDAKHNLELALQEKEEQEQQSNTQQSDEEQNNQDSSDPQEQDSEQDTPTSQEQTPDEQPEGSQSEEDQNLTPEEATRLLNTLLSEVQTLQQELENNQNPGTVSGQGW